MFCRTAEQEKEVIKLELEYFKCDTLLELEQIENELLQENISECDSMLKRDSLIIHNYKEIIIPEKDNQIASMKIQLKLSDDEIKKQKKQKWWWIIGTGLVTGIFTTTTIILAK